MIFPEFQELETARLRLRRLTMEDVPLYYERLGSSPKVTENMLWNPHQSISESVASIEKALRRYAEGKCYRWGIALREDNALIGVIELLRFDEEAGTCSFAYMLGEDFWNRGYGTEAVTAAFGFAICQMGVKAIIADHFAENPASGAVMRKVGMQYTQVIPGKYEKNGVKHDAVEYMITAGEWNPIAVRSAFSDDAAALGTIMSRSFRSAFSEFVSQSTLDACAGEGACVGLMGALLAEGKMRFLLGLLNARPVGELVWSAGEGPEWAEIQAIHSLPESWGSGLGAAMLEKAMADMAGEGYRTVGLWAFRENKRARRFYEKHGFTFTGGERVSEFDGAVEVQYIRSI